MLEYILELIYPTVCGFCGNACKEAVCKKCEIKWEYILSKLHPDLKYSWHGEKREDKSVANANSCL